MKNWIAFGGGKHQKHSDGLRAGQSLWIPPSQVPVSVLVLEIMILQTSVLNMNTH